MVDTAGEVLGKVKQRQPNWFQDSEDHLRHTFWQETAHIGSG